LVSRKQVSEIFSYLFGKYRKLGCDYFFKSKKIAGETCFNAEKVGRICMVLYENKCLACWNIDSPCSAKTWKTIFDNISLDLRDDVIENGLK